MPTNLSRAVWTEEEDAVLRSVLKGKMWPQRVIEIWFKEMSKNPETASLAKRGAIAWYTRSRRLFKVQGDKSEYPASFFQPKHSKRPGIRPTGFRKKMVANKVTTDAALRFASDSQSESGEDEAVEGNAVEDEDEPVQYTGKGKEPADEAEPVQYTGKGKEAADEAGVGQAGGTRLASTRNRKVPDKLKAHDEKVQVLRRGPKQPTQRATPYDGEGRHVAQKAPRRPVNPDWRKPGQCSLKHTTASLMDADANADVDADDERLQWSPGSNGSTRSMKASQDADVDTFIAAMSTGDNPASNGKEKADEGNAVADAITKDADTLMSSLMGLEPQVRRELVYLGDMENADDFQKTVDAAVEAHDANGANDAIDMAPIAAPGLPGSPCTARELDGEVIKDYLQALKDTTEAALVEPVEPVAPVEPAPVEPAPAIVEPVEPAPAIVEPVSAPAAVVAAVGLFCRFVHKTFACIPRKM